MVCEHVYMNTSPPPPQLSSLLRPLNGDFSDVKVLKKTKYIDAAYNFVNEYRVKIKI